MTVVEARRRDTMSDLQLALIAGGVVVVAAIAIYNVIQERAARKRAESAFGERPPDALLGGDPAAPRREPTLGEVAPPSDFVEAAETLATLPPAQAPEESAPQAEISSHVDTVAVILAEEPVLSEQLEPLHAVLQG